MYHNVFKSWFSLERLNLRCKCFKGDSGSNKTPETASQVASAEIAMNNFNDYMREIRPFEDKYVADVTRDPAVTESKVQGQIGADLAQKVGTQPVNPTQGINPSAVSKLATTTARAKNAGSQAVANQRAASYQSVIDMGMGKNSTAQTGMANLAQQSVSAAVNDAAINQEEQNSNAAAGATMGGIALGMSKNLYDDSKKK